MTAEQTLKDQFYLMKAILLKAGGELELTKEEFMAAMDMRFEMVRGGPKSENWRVRLVEVKR